MSYLCARISQKTYKIRITNHKIGSIHTNFAQTIHTGVPNHSVEHLIMDRWDYFSIITNVESLPTSHNSRGKQKQSV